MSQPTLFLMIGYPGSGKTTTAKMIHTLTGAVHLWADHERKKMFEHPQHNHAENLALYDALNTLTDHLLQEGKSVVFDTNFNFYKDRKKLRRIAARHGAKTITVWITTPKEIARERATKDAHKQHTRILGDMPVEHFERIAGNLQEPRPDEHAIQLDGTRIDMALVAHALEQHDLTRRA
jgi:predicted kinase